MPKKQATPALTQPKTTGTTATDESLEKVIKDFKSSWDYCKGSQHDRWQNNYKAYNNERTKRGYFGITDTFVPMTFGTVETLTSALFGPKPKFNFLSPRDKPDQKTDILNSLVDYYWERDQWSIKVINTGRTGLMLGNGIDYFCWVGDHPVMFNVPLRDFFIDPTATSFEDARYMGRRYLTTIEELKTYEVIDLDNPIETTNPETGETEVTYAMKPKYTNLDKARKATEGGTGAGKTQEKLDKQEKDDMYGSTLSGDDHDQVEVIEYWTDDKVVSVMSRQYKIEDAENYYKAKSRANGDEYPEGIMPFAGFRDYVDPSLFYAKGEVDFIIDEQELLNDLTNQRIDAVTYVLNPMYTLDPKYADKIKEVENLPGAVYPFEAGTLQRIDMGTVSPDSFNEAMNIKNDIRETTASNEVVRGGATQGGKSTATEINAQIAGAGQRINLKVTQIENEYFHRMARIVFAMIKLYVTEPMMVRIVGKDGARWEEFDPADFQGDFEPRVQLDIAIENKKQEQAAQAKELLAAFMGDPDVNQQELKKLVLARSFDLEPDEVEILMQPVMPMPGMGDPMQDPAMMGGAIPAGAVPTPSPAGMIPAEDLALLEASTPPDIMIDPITGEPLDMTEVMA